MNKIAAIIEVFKETLDNWHPSYILEGYDTSLVRVSFIQLFNKEWRVCVWGEYDMGMEKDFPEDQKEAAWRLFLEIIGLKEVNISDLEKRGLISA